MNREQAGGPMKRSSLLMIVATLAAGCAIGSPPTVAPSPTATTAPTPSAPSVATPAPTPAVTPAPALSPTAPPSADWPPVPEDDDELLPPIARLVLADGTVRAGVLGSFSYRESSADSPWISGGLEQLTAPAGVQLTVGLLPGNSFSAWQASYAAADDRTGEQILPLASGSGANLERARFDAPPQGEWVVQVMLMFPGDDGDATYYWRVSVP